MRKLLVISLVLIALLPGRKALSANQSVGSALHNSSISAPEGVHAKPEVNGALLQWQPVQGAKGYRIYWEQERNVASYSAVLDSITAERISYQVRDLSPGVLYTFAVSALSSSQESPLSAQTGVIPTAQGKKTLLQDYAP